MYSIRYSGMKQRIVLAWQPSESMDHSSVTEVVDSCATEALIFECQQGLPLEAVKSGIEWRTPD